MPLRIEEESLPNPGFTLGRFYIGKHMIGRATRRTEQAEGGWKLMHGRKLLTDVQAAKAMLDRAINAAKEQDRLARKLLAALRMYCGPGGIPADGTKPPIPAAPQEQQK